MHNANNKNIVATITMRNSNNTRCLKYQMDYNNNKNVQCKEQRTMIFLTMKVMELITTKKTDNNYFYNELQYLQ